MFVANLTCYPCCNVELQILIAPIMQSDINVMSSNTDVLLKLAKSVECSAAKYGVDFRKPDYFHDKYGILSHLFLIDGSLQVLVSVLLKL